MLELAKSVSGEMVDLEYRIKTASSVKDKISRKAERGISETEAISSMSDLVRYTLLVEHDKTVCSFDKIIDYLYQNGYHVIAVDNKYVITNSDYKGLHINIISPEGQLFELQIHSKESLNAKNKNHLLYEEFRNVKTTAARKKVLEQQMKENSQTFSMPKDIAKVKNLKGDV